MQAPLGRESLAGQAHGSVGVTCVEESELEAVSSVTVTLDWAHPKPEPQNRPYFARTRGAGTKTGRAPGVRARLSSCGPSRASLCVSERPCLLEITEGSAAPALDL